MITYIFIGVLILFIITSFLLLKYNNKIRKEVYGYFILAEKHFSVGSEKMDYVLSNTYNLLPDVAKIFINEDLYAMLVQKLFDGFKNFLDDGKIN